jgi:2-polyprenyl-3-methyl-5-hydroxy-6-metoxy-1,4-benzoquinol methylase
MIDRSNGYEKIAAEFLTGRSGPRSTRIGAQTVRTWARQLAPGCSVLDLGCGSGVPITEVLIDERLCVYGVDASQSLVAAFKQRWPNTPVNCEAVEESPFFGRRFDAVLAWGLLFLMSAASQRELIGRMSTALKPAGRLLFTSPEEAVTWNDAMTGRESRSLGAAQYQQELAAAGLTLRGQYDDEGKNHYYDAVKESATASVRHCDPLHGEGL